MKLARHLLSISLLTKIAMAAPASEPLSLEKAIEEAKHSNPIFQQAKAVSEEASWRPLEALSANLPKLTVGVSHFFDLKYQEISIAGPPPFTVPLVFPGTLLSLGASWTVFDGLSTWKSFSAARLNEEAADLNLQHSELTLEQQIRLKFYRAIAAQMLSNVAEQNVTTLEDHLSKTQTRVKGGTATRFDILRIRVQLEEAIPEKLASDDNVALSRRELAQAMGLEVDSRPLTGTMPTPEEKLLPPGTKFEFNQRPDLVALQKRAEASDKAHTSAIGLWFPKITFNAEKQFYNNKNLTFGTDQFKDAYSIGVLLSWNVFDGGLALAKTAASAAQRDQAEAVARAALLKAPVEMDQWRRKFYYNVSLYRARTRAIESAEESVRLAKLGLDAGTRTNSDVLDAELDLFRARAGLVRAQLDAAEAILNLELALGRKILK